MNAQVFAVKSLSRHEGDFEFNHLEPNQILKAIRQDFYQCQFDAVIKAVDSVDWTKFSDIEYVDIQILKANALYEAHDITASKELLHALTTFRNLTDKAALAYAIGRQFYFDGNYAESRASFEAAAAEATCIKLKFRSILGTANVLLSERNLTTIPMLIAQLQTLKAGTGIEDQVSLLILLGNFYRDQNKEVVMARKYYHQAVTVAAKSSWNYFLIRALYGLATLEKQENRLKEMQTVLAILKSLLTDSESKFFSFLVTDKFKDDTFSLDLPMTIDHRNMKIKFHDSWYHFHAKPLLFKLIVLLEARQIFVSKEDIATHLWPGEKYLTHTHDARIFDIVKRVRQIFESYADNPMVILSGRQGYKLACQTEALNPPTLEVPNVKV